MKTICKYLGYCTIALGIIASIGMAKNLGVAITEGRRGAELIRSWPLTILYFIFGLFVTAACAAVLLGISEILEHLETIKGGSPETSNMSEENALAKLAKIEAETFWKCPNCGKNNPPHTGTCSCGQDKP